MSEMQQLRGFVADVMREFNNDGYCGDLDGGALQEIATKHGLLVETRMEAACDPEVCVCAETCDFPTTCYRHSPLLQSLLAISPATEVRERDRDGNPVERNDPRYFTTTSAAIEAAKVQAACETEDGTVSAFPSPADGGRAE